MKKIRIISDFSDTARGKGWKVKEEPNLINFITRLHNIGISNLDLRTVEDVLKIIETIKKGRWSIDDFVKHVTTHYSQVLYYNMYKSGQISLQEFKKRMSAYI